MNVAPSFKDYDIISDPFKKGGKDYVRARNPSTSKERDIRIYTDAEFRKQYPNKSKEDTGFAMLKHARGFDKGPILIIRNNTEDDEWWLRQSVARYAVGLGWYIASEDTLPPDALPHFRYLLLSFDEFKDKDDFHAKTPEELEKLLNNKAKKGEWINI